MEATKYIQNLLKIKGVEITPKNKTILDIFSNNTEVQAMVKTILDNQDMILDKFKITNRIFDIQNQSIILPNATVNKPYAFVIDVNGLRLNDIIEKKIEGLEEIGLVFYESTNTIEGIPKQSGDLKIKFCFKIKGESVDTPLNVKLIPLVINPNPKDLWKSIPSNQQDLFSKEDDVSVFDTIGEKSIVISSKRGRSHADKGTFRDDDFSYKYLDSGWSVVAVSDGAGSASLARKGSLLACESVVEYFDKLIEKDKLYEFEGGLNEYMQMTSKHNPFERELIEQKFKDLEILSKKLMYQATLHVYNQIKKNAENTYTEKPALFDNPKAKSVLDYFHSTLIFVFFKKFDFGYVILTFGVGDCPIALMNKDKTKTKMLNWLDVGTFGGGTRFITQGEIFTSQERPMATRFSFNIIDDFSYLFLMTDGIYDPKFVVEANLDKHEKWLDFLSDLDGNNDESNRVNFDKDNKEINLELSKWMDFWSIGNHDDRTLAIIF